MAGYSTVEEVTPQHPVFINFRGVDLRYGFVSHLVTALKRKKINVFINNHEDRGEPIAILIERIRESRVAVAIFSGKYTESKWCVTELEMIKDCMDKGTLKVIPIFYNVDSATVRDLKGGFGDAFRLMAKGDERRKTWEGAFMAISLIMGITIDKKSKESEKVNETVKAVKTVLNNIPLIMANVLDEKSDESTTIKQTVRDVWKVLEKNPLEGNQIASVETTVNRNSLTSSSPQMYTTFGIEQRLMELEKKLDLKDKKTRIIGVVGMPGIGKTTLLKELFKKCQGKFQNCALIDEIREKSKFYNLSKLLVQELLALNESALDNEENPYEMFKVSVQDCKVLIILDDVSKKEQLDALLGKHDWIKDGSRIVIATNNISLLKDMDHPVDYDPYVVQKLNPQYSLNLFSYHAFDQDNPPKDFMKLSEEFVYYSKGHPLALKKLGAELRGKSKDIWASQLMNLAQSLNPNIGSAFQASYDELSPGQKDAFLDIACFRSQDVDYVQSILASSEAMGEVEEAMGALTNKFLINICDGRVEMHDLLYTFSRELDPRASFEGGSKKRRLYRHQDIIKQGEINVLQNNMRAANVRGIFLDLSEVKGETILDKDHLRNMYNLRYLKFYNSHHCPQECKTHNMIYLHDGLSLPLKEIRCLHWLKFPLDELPNDFHPINLVDLKLPYSEIEQLWDGDKETPALRWVDLNHSNRLRSLSGLSKAQNLQALNLEECKSLESLRGVDSKSLKILTLSGCSNFKEFPLIPENLEALYLDGTAISELPDNVKNLQRLILLNMKNCKLLKNIPTCVGELRALQKLVLSGCRKLNDFPEINESSLKILLLDGTSIKMMPQLPSVQYLCLSRNDRISYLPEGINQLSRLTRLDLKYCTSLTSIPELPPNLQYLDADGCSSLKTVAKPLARIMPTVQNHCIFNFTNCGNLEQAAMEEMASFARRKCQLLSDARKHYNKGLSSESLFSTCFPGSEVPSWFCHDGVGSLLKLRLPPNWHEKSLTGIALCAVVSFPGDKDQISGLSVACTFTITDNEQSLIPFTCPVGSWIRKGEMIQCNHIFIAYISCPHTIRCLEDGNSGNCNFTEASVEFTVTGGTSEIGKVSRCGLSLVYEKDKNKHSSLQATYDMPVEVKNLKTGWWRNDA